MNLEQAYQRIWERKLDGIEPPDVQEIDRVKWTAALFPADATGPLVDVGCGSGAMLAEARRRGWEAAGLDRDASVVAWLRAQGFSNTGECLIDSEPWPLYPAFWEIVTFCDVIEHLVDPIYALREGFRALHSNGRLYVATPNCAFWWRVQRLANGAMFRTNNDPELRDGGHLSYWGPHDLRDALLDVGFNPVTIHYEHKEEAPAGWHFGFFSDWSYMIAEAVKP